MPGPRNHKKKSKQQAKKASAVAVGEGGGGNQPNAQRQRSSRQQVQNKAQMLSQHVRNDSRNALPRRPRSGSESSYSVLPAHLAFSSTFVYGDLDESVNSSRSVSQLATPPPLMKTLVSERRFLDDDDEREYEGDYEDEFAGLGLRKSGGNDDEDKGKRLVRSTSLRREGNEDELDEWEHHGSPNSTADYTAQSPIASIPSYAPTPQPACIHDPGNGPRVKDTRMFLSSYFCQPPAMDDPLCAAFAQEEVLEMLKTVLPENTALILWYNKSRSTGRICPACQRLYKLGDVLPDHLHEGSYLDDVDQSQQRYRPLPQLERERDISGLCSPVCFILASFAQPGAIKSTWGRLAEEIPLEALRMLNTLGAGEEETPDEGLSLLLRMTRYEDLNLGEICLRGSEFGHAGDGKAEPAVSGIWVEEEDGEGEKSTDELARGLNEMRFPSVEEAVDEESSARSDPWSKGLSDSWVPQVVPSPRPRSRPAWSWSGGSAYNHCWSENESGGEMGLDLGFGEDVISLVLLRS